jgi:hypothetical protein
MLRINQLEEIQQLLFRIPGLTDRLERKDPEFAEEVRRWLQDVEETLENNQIPSVGIVASLRATLTASEQGWLAPEAHFVGRPTIRKVKNAMASHVLKQTGDVISEAVHGDVARMKEAEELLRQLVTLAKAKGILPLAVNDNTPTEHLRAIWSMFMGDADLAAGAVRVEGLLGPYDSLVVLDRAISADMGPNLTVVPRH